MLFALGALSVVVILILTAWATHHSSPPNIQDAPMNYLQTNQAVWLHSCMDAQMGKALAGCRTIQIQPSLHSPPLRCVGAQRPFAGTHATTDANPCFSYHKSSITPSWCCHVGYRDVLHSSSPEDSVITIYERRIPVKTLLIHMFTASPDMNIGNKVWGYRIYSSRTPTSNALF